MSTASFVLAWAVQVAVAILLLPVLLLVLAVGGVGVVILWLTGSRCTGGPAEDQARDP